MFHVPGSSTPPAPPATPDAKRASTTNPSTTPAGPPPPSATHDADKSFTPVGPPPISLLGSSQFNLGTNTTSSFSQKLQDPARPGNRFAALGGSSVSSSKGVAFQVPDSSPPQSTLFRGKYAQDAEDDEDDVDGYGEEDIDDEQTGNAPAKYTDESRRDDTGMDDAEDMETEEDRDEDGSDLLDFGGQSLNKKENGLVGTVYSVNDANSSMLNNSMSKSVLWQRQLQKSLSNENEDLARAIKSVAGSVEAAPLFEPDEIILQTETTLRHMYRAMRNEYTTDSTDAVYGAAETLSRNWRDYAIEELESRETEAEETPFWKANYLASLMLELHHPPRKRASRLNNMSRSGTSQFQGMQKPIPKVLLDWVNAYHESDMERILDVQSHKPNSTAHPDFWDLIYDCLNKGKLDALLSILKGADFTYAPTAEEDGLDSEGYGPKYVENIHMVVGNVIDVVSSAPAVQSGDWDVKNADWALFRRRLSQATSDLRDFAEGSAQRGSKGRNANKFTAESFGISNFGSESLNMSTATRRATSAIPWSIYENILQIYSFLQGDPDTVISASMDWTDAVVGLTVWWDGEDDDVTKGGLAASRRTPARSQRARPADVTPVLAYQNRLASSLARVTQDAESEMAVNTMDNTEVGLAAVFAGDVKSAISLIRGFSLTAAAAIAEIADAGSWTTRTSGKVTDALERSDLIVLNHGKDEKEDMSTKDAILVEYAGRLAEKEVLMDPASDMTEEGWETALRILGRLEGNDVANEQIRSLLDQLDLIAPKRVDKILNTCSSLGFTDEARRLAEKFADGLTESSSSEYGNALLYYARAHQADKVKELLDILSSFCLVQSAAYPPESELDDCLATLTSSPASSLTRLDKVDHEAAMILSRCLSGYATLRRFYNLRDNQPQRHDKTQGGRAGARVAAAGVSKKAKRKQQKKDAAGALVALIQSASDSIRGGLFDPDADAVMQVDGLLALLGEALPFINHKPRILTSSQLYAIIAVVEDLQTVAPRVYAQCDQFLASTLAHAAGRTEDVDLSNSIANHNTSSTKINPLQAKSINKNKNNKIAKNTSPLKTMTRSRTSFRKTYSGATNTSEMASSSQFSMVGSSMMVPAGGIGGSAGSIGRAKSFSASMGSSSSGLLLGNRGSGGDGGGDGEKQRGAADRDKSRDGDGDVQMGMGMEMDVDVDEESEAAAAAAGGSGDAEGKEGEGVDGSGSDSVQIKRRWDWRMGWKGGAKGEDVLRLLRLNVAKELARAWLDGEE